MKMTVTMSNLINEKRKLPRTSGASINEMASDYRAAIVRVMTNLTRNPKDTAIVSNNSSN